MRLLRNTLSKNEQITKSAKILDNLLKLPEYKSSEIIFTYLSFGSEVDTKQLIKKLLDLKKTVCIPKIINKNIKPIIINTLDSLSLSKFGYYEPHKNSPIAKKIDLCITPGLAFTRFGERLGYGGGYYDRFFKTHPKIIKLSLAYEIQILDEIPTNQDDQLIDILISEKEIIRCQKPKR